MDKRLACKLRGEDYVRDDKENEKHKRGRHHQNYKSGVYSSITFMTLSDEERNFIAAAEMAGDPYFGIKEDIKTIDIRYKRITDEIERIRDGKGRDRNGDLARMEAEATKLYSQKAKLIETLLTLKEINEEKDTVVGFELPAEAAEYAE